MATKGKSSSTKRAKKRNPSIDKYEVERAANTLMEAEEIKVKPKLLSAAKRELKARQKALVKVMKSVDKK